MKSNMGSTVNAGFRYVVERFVGNDIEWVDEGGVLRPVVRRLGRLAEREEVKNLIPIQGLNHMLDVTFLGAAQVTQWFIGLTTNDYAPQSTDTMATYPTVAGETSAYSGTVRLNFTPGAVANGLVDNVAAKAEFTFTAPTTVRGGFIASTSTRGLASGILASAVRFSTPKIMDTGEILRVTAGNQLTSA